MAQVRIIPDEIVASVISLPEVIALIETGFADDANGANRNFGVVRERLAPAHQGIFGIKSGLAGTTLGLKAGGFWNGNRERGIPPHQSTMVLFDPDTGEPTAFIGANRITGLRTGAAGAVAVKHLARANAGSIALIGCGAQGRMQLRAIATVRNLTSARVWDISADAAASFARELSAELGLPIEVATDPAHAVTGAEIIVTTTPGERVVLAADSVHAGQHINAIGSDTAGKQEVETKALLRAKVVVDNRVQALALGESQHLHKLAPDPALSIYAELGEIITGVKPGRTNDEEITLFDATGVTFQDLVVAAEIQRRCETDNLGIVVTF